MTDKPVGRHHVSLSALPSFYASPSIPPSPDRLQSDSLYVFPWVPLGCCKDCCKAFSLALIVKGETMVLRPPTPFQPHSSFLHPFLPRRPPPLLRHTLQGQLTDAQWSTHSYTKHALCAASPPLSRLILAPGLEASLRSWPVFGSAQCIQICAHNIEISPVNLCVYV